jgi:hypothetical protein
MTLEEATVRRARRTAMGVPVQLNHERTQSTMAKALAADSSQRTLWVPQLPFLSFPYRSFDGSEESLTSLIRTSATGSSTL